MSGDDLNFRELHWVFSIIQHVDVGLVVLDRDYNIALWNGFMENHSGQSSASVKGENIFRLFPDISEEWLKRKVESVRLLNNRAFSTWQQRPYLIKFDSYRPITGRSKWMYQNVTLFPLTSASGEVEHVCLIIYDVTETAMDAQALQNANLELELLGRTDGLTGLYNRRAWEEMLRSEFKRSARTKQPCTLVMFDIDHFKKVNDTYGHQAGDEVIRMVADTLRATKRGTDLAGRYGGEEFGVILVDTDIAGGQYFAERMRKAVEKSGVTYGAQAIHFTISLGVAEVSAGVANHKAWIELADLALYQSKQGGRNRTTARQGDSDAKNNPDHLPD